MASALPPDIDRIVAKVLPHFIGTPDGCRAVGSQTSKSPCFETVGRRLHENLAPLLDWVEPGVVRAAGWTVVLDVLKFVERGGYALPTIGEWHGQTIAGVVSTGTHGGSYLHGSICASVLRVMLIDGQGQLQTFEKGTTEFRAVIGSFGTTGIIVALDLACVPTFDLVLQRRRFSIEEYARELVRNQSQAVFRAAVWVSATPWVVDDASKPIAPQAGPRDLPARREPRFGDKASIFDWLARRVGIAWLFSSIGAKDYRGTYTAMLAPIDGDAATILKRRKLQRTPVESEFAIALDKTEAFIADLLTLLRRGRYTPDRMIGLRPMAGDDFWLSPTRGNPCLWVSFFIHSHNPLVPPLIDLLRRFDALPHWGKHSMYPAESIAAMYPDWKTFLTVREQLDPNRVFVNGFARALGM